VSRAELLDAASKEPLEDYTNAPSGATWQLCSSSSSSVAAAAAGDSANAPAGDGTADGDAPADGGDGSGSGSNSSSGEVLRIWMPKHASLLGQWTSKCCHGLDVTVHLPRFVDHVVG
jgi:hypothetical protein